MGSVAAYLQYRNIIMEQVYICDKSASGMSINPPIVFHLRAKGGSSTTFSRYLAMLVLR
jgi:hypothetical protein